METCKVQTKSNYGHAGLKYVYSSQEHSEFTCFGVAPSVLKLTRKVQFVHKFLNHYFITFILGESTQKSLLYEAVVCTHTTSSAKFPEAKKISEEVPVNIRFLLTQTSSFVMFIGKINGAL